MGEEACFLDSQYQYLLEQPDLCDEREAIVLPNLFVCFSLSSFPTR